jgi:hypothetical protein
MRTLDIDHSDPFALAFGGDWLNFGLATPLS